jgi:hypothetical protein
MLNGKLFKNPIGRLSEGRPTKLAKINKLSLQLFDSKLDKSELQFSTKGATSSVLGKIRKL